MPGLFSGSAVSYLAYFATSLPSACQYAELVSHRHQYLSKVIAARHQARESPSVFARSDVTDAAAPELFVPVVLGDDPLVARS